MTEKLQAQSTQGALPDPKPDVGAAPAVAAAASAGHSAATTPTTTTPPPPPVNGAVAAAAPAAAAPPASAPVSAPAAASTLGLPVDVVATKIELVEEEPYTIKCICDCSDDDGNTIYCETCDTWQHIDCFYPNNREEALRDEFAHSCAECKPRPLDRQRAIERLRLLKIISAIDAEAAAERKHAADAAAATAATAAIAVAASAPAIEKKPKRPPSKGHKKKPKPADLPPINGSGSGSGRSSYENGKHGASPTDHLHHHQQQPAAKKAKTSHKSSQSVSSSTSQPTHVPAPAPPAPPSSSSKRSPPPHGVAAPSNLLSPATTPPDLPDNFQIHAYSTQFCSLYSEPPVTIVHSNSFANLVISNTMSLWLREPVRLRKETGRSFDEIFEDLSAGTSGQRPHLRLGEKTSMLDAGGGLLHWRFLTTDGPIDKDVPLAELNGAVGFQKDYCTACDSRWSELTSPLPFVFFHPLLPLYIDTRREGSQARYVRRSCRPNTQLGTSLSGESQYHFWLVSDRPIGPNEQITLPWDFRLPKQLGARWLHLLGLADGEPHRHEAEMTEEEYGQISEWVHRILSEYGGCACDLGSNCAFARFHRRYLFAKSQQQQHHHHHHHHHQPPQQQQQQQQHQQQEPQLHPPQQQQQQQQSDQPRHEQQPRPTAKKRPPLPAPPSAASSAKKAKTHTVSPTSTGHATNSRAPSENRTDDGPDTDSRSGSDNRSKPPSRDRTPVRQGSFDQLGILTEPTDRDKRKVAMAEDTFRRMEEQQQQPPRKKKRGSDGAMTGQPGAAILSRPKTNTAPILTSTDSNYVDAASGTSRSKSASPMSAVSPSTARGSVPLPRARGPGPATAWTAMARRPVYIDAAVQTDPEDAEPPAMADSEFRMAKPRKRIISLTQRLLSSRHDMVLREAERRRSLADVDRPESSTTPATAATAETAETAATAANSIPKEVDQATPSSRQRSESVATAVSDCKGSPMLSRPGSTAPADSPIAEPAPLSPTMLAHPLIKPEMPSPTTSLETIKTDLNVQAPPPVPLFRQASPGAATAEMLATNPPPVTSPPLAQSPFPANQVAGSAPPPAASSAVAATPSPVKKKLSLSDYNKRILKLGKISTTNLSTPTGEDAKSAEPADSSGVEKAAENEAVA